MAFNGPVVAFIFGRAELYLGPRFEFAPNCGCRLKVVLFHCCCHLFWNASLIQFQGGQSYRRVGLSFYPGRIPVMADI